MQILPVMKFNEQVLTDSQCNGQDYVDIEYLIGVKPQRQ